MDKNDHDMVVELDFLIKKMKDFDTAYKVLDEYLEERGAIKHNAPLYFRGALIVSLLGGNPGSYLELARESDGYSRIMEGDFWRGEMLRLINEGKFIQAELLVNQIEQLHRKSLNRRAALEMMRGRLAFAQGEYLLALSYHGFAEDFWDLAVLEEKKVNTKWRLTNAFHGFKAAMHVGDQEKAAKYLSYFLRNEPADSPRRKEIELITNR